MAKGVVGAVIYAKEMQSDEGIKCTNPEELEILNQNSEVFAKPKELPPYRDCDHTIPLSPEAKPINVKPYRLPYHKKDAIAELIEQLLKAQLLDIVLVHTAHQPFL